MDKKTLINNLDKIHTTELGLLRIKRNLGLCDENIIEYCKKVILNSNSEVIKCGKNYYCKFKNVVLTINSYSYTIITGKVIK